MRALIGTIAALAMAAGAQAAQPDGPSCSIDPSKPKYYRLELTVPATFCMGSGGKKDPSCASFPKPGIQLHGLWPNYQAGYPSGTCGAACKGKGKDNGGGKFCAYPKPEGLYESKAWNAGKGYMAGLEKCLERHEWIKHGTCSPMKPADYFGWALEHTKAFADAVAPMLDRPVARSEFDALIAKKFPKLDGAVHLKCKGKFVNSLYVSFEWGQQPGAPMKTKGGANSYGNCGNDFIFPSKI